MSGDANPTNSAVGRRRRRWLPLGLTLARDLMTAMGGTLHAASVDGIGSTFTASIPLADVEG